MAMNPNSSNPAGAVDALMRQSYPASSAQTRNRAFPANSGCFRRVVPRQLPMTRFALAA